MYRQKDKEFIRILSAIRSNSITSKDLKIINTQYRANINFEELEGYIYLTTVNQLAEEINLNHLNKLKVSLMCLEEISMASLMRSIFLPSMS